MDKCHSETYPLILIQLVRSMRQKHIWSKQCWSNNIEAQKKYLVPKNFNKIIFLSTKKIFDPKFLGNQKFFRSENRFWRQIFLDPIFLKYFWTLIFLGPKNFLNALDLSLICLSLCTKFRTFSLIVS